MYLKFEDAINKYLNYAYLKQKKTSYDTLQRRVNNAILPFFNGYNLYDITDSDYLDWQNYICDNNNYSNNYKKCLHFLMCGFFEYCISYLNLEYNIARKVGNFKLRNIKLVYHTYSLKDFNKFIRFVDNEVYKQFFNLLFFTGLRPGEAMALKFSDLKKYSISVNKTISEHFIEGERLIDDPKSICSFREVVIDKKLYNNLFKLKKLYINKYNLSDYDYFIFGGLKPLAPTTINRYKLKACNLANLFPIKLHEFRHSHASLLYSYNIPIKDIQNRLGHNDIKITMNTYVHSDNKKRITRILNLLRLFN